jgi:hypothetical protein
VADRLDDVPRPPGESGVNYQEACVMRSAGKQLQIYKFPLEITPLDRPYYFVDDEVMKGASGMAKDGVPIYPYYDNRKVTAWDSCEVDFCNAHSGKGEDYHYHGDPFGDRCAYSSSDYTESHPPFVG